MVNVPPWNSFGCSLLSRALPANVLIVDEIDASPFAPTSGTMGVIRPFGVATAMEISALWYLQNIAGEGEECQQGLTKLMFHCEKGCVSSDILSDHIAHPGRIGFRDILKSNGRSFNYKVIDRKFDTSFNTIFRTLFSNG